MFGVNRHEDSFY